MKLSTYMDTRYITPTVLLPLTLLALLVLTLPLAKMLPYSEHLILIYPLRNHHSTHGQPILYLYRILQLCRQSALPRYCFYSQSATATLQQYKTLTNQLNHRLMILHLSNGVDSCHSHISRGGNKTLEDKAGTITEHNVIAVG